MNSQNLPAVQFIQEAEHTIAAARDVAGMGKILNFNKGDYFIGEDMVPMGTEFIAYCNEWLSRWVKFGQNGVEDSRLYAISKGQKPVERSELGDNNMALWPPSQFSGGAPRDPWVLQDLLPMESRETGEIVAFRSSSWGGRQAVGNLCLQYGNMKKRDAQAAKDDGFSSRNPIIRIGKGYNISKKFGKIARPEFEIIGWDVPGPADVMDIRRETGDEVPF